MVSPSRQRVAEIAGVSPEAVDEFFRPSRQSPGAARDPATDAARDDKVRRIVEALIETGYTNDRRGSLGRKTILFELPRTWVHDSPMAGAVTSSQIADSTLFGSVTAALSRAAGTEGARLEIVTNLSDLTWPRGLPEGEEWTRLRRRYSAKTATKQLARIVAERPRSIAGIVIIDPARDDERLRWLSEQGVPHVVMGRPPGTRGDGHVVDIDDEAGFELLTRYVRGLGIEASAVGHVRFLDDQTGPPGRRRSGVLKGLGLPGAPLSRRTRLGRGTDAHSLEVDYHDTDQAAIVQQIALWLDSNRWRAVIADCDRFASYVAKAAAQVGLEIAREPRENCVVLAGCDDSIERHAAPVAWATLRQPVHEWATKVVSCLVRQNRAHWNELEPILVKPVLVTESPG